LNSPNPVSNALIAGCGYLGLRVARNWLDSETRVSAFTRSADRAATLQAMGIQPIVVDLANSDQPLPPLPAVDTVLWAVGYDRSTGVAREDIWLKGLQRLIDALQVTPRRFLYVSSTSVYGQIDGEIIDENNPACPTTEGGQCCLQAEQLLKERLSELHPQTEPVVLRMAGLYGPDRLLRRIDQLKSQTPLTGDPSHWLNLIHIDDAVKAVNFAATTNSIPPVLNVVNSDILTRAAYYQLLADLVDAPPPEFSDSSSSPTRQRGGNKRVTSRWLDSMDIGFQYQSVADGLRHAVENSHL
jgi:nucleoside-diphosphate-sugar epimerase